MVNIGFLAGNFKTYSSKRLIEEAKNLKQNLVKIIPESICLFVDQKLKYSIHRKNLLLQVILPRFVEHQWTFSILVLKHFEKMGVPVVNSSESIMTCKNKFLTSLALKRKKIPQPRSALAFSDKDVLKHIKKMQKPLVLKLIDKSRGKGVSRINDDIEAEDWVETILRFRTPIYIQEYIPHPGEDYRVFVIGNRVVGAMKRKAQLGKWKANVSMGGTPNPYKPNEEIKEIAIKCREAVKADICGVDLMIHENIPKVIEVNHNVGFKGLEKVSKNIAKEIIKYTVKKAKR